MLADWADHLHSYKKQKFEESFNIHSLLHKSSFAVFATLENW
jgi:hypothetical protein